MKMDKIKVRIGIGAVEVLSLDEPSLRRGISIRYTKKHAWLEGTEEQLTKLRDDFVSRTMSGWDQPASWFYSAKCAANAITKALNMNI